MENWTIEAYPEAIVTQVYDSNSPKRGMAQIDYTGSLEIEGDIKSMFTVDAWILYPYGFKPDTEDNQVSINRLNHPMNQPYGIWSPPRRGDKVLALCCGPNRWFIVGSLPFQGNEHTISDQNDMSFIHRSGASIRMNDRYPGVTGGTGEFDGITGNMSLVGNRTMMLIGSKFLPFGLLGNHAFHSTIKFDLNDGTTSDYATRFDNGDPNSVNYYEPWDSNATSKLFMSPPDNVLANQFFMLHQGGGVMKIFEQPLAINYSGLKIAMGGITISAGTKYWGAGMKDQDDCSSEGVADATKTTNPVSGTIRIQQENGAYIELGANGQVTIVTGNGQDYTIDVDDNGDLILRTEGTGDVILDAAGSGVVKLGGSGAVTNVVKHGDSTSAHVVINAFGISTYEATTGHTHTVNASQTEVKVP